LLAPARVRFRYRLAGLENEWVDAQQDRVADYNRLPPGSYEFHVTASSPGGIWREGASPVKLEVVPRLWERNSVRAAGAASVLGAVAAVAWGVTRARMRRRLILLEAQQAVERERAERERALEEERARIARDLHDDLGASLTEITVLADTGMRPPEPGEKMPGLFHSISMKSRQMVSALDAIVWAVDPEENSLQSLADYLAGFAGDYLTESGISCRFRIPVSFPAIRLDGQARHELFLVVKETLHNVVQHAGATEVEFRLAWEDRRLLITLADNGAGFDASTVRDGHGLKNFAERLGKLGGRCAIESRPGTGTKVEISLPLADSDAAGVERPAGSE
jgi:signal transduction histidine kinase